jgi:hypothetical protein
MSKIDHAYVTLRQALVACGAVVGHNRIDARTIEVLTSCTAQTARKLYRDMVALADKIDERGFLTRDPREWAL